MSLKPSADVTVSSWCVQVWMESDEEEDEEEEESTAALETWSREGDLLAADDETRPLVLQDRLSELLRLFRGRTERQKERLVDPDESEEETPSKAPPPPPPPEEKKDDVPPAAEEEEEEEEKAFVLPFELLGRPVKIPKLPKLPKLSPMPSWLRVLVDYRFPSSIDPFTGELQTAVCPSVCPSVHMSS
ncbi:Cyclic nucleotide-gated cation channel beta-1 [Liparis tanakae]|uniref:Cyclic nucleotide-gated cation channel beta-1 n=1 Tax=Liparis tanakae TaxID=230148 RepID=A0A4Z2ERN9_9TELE|nr:Cyclic nucleotide-gated cation channel beta-1 [Liparis tanakae]